MYMRLMHKEDIDQVTEIDREIFPTIWPPANYRNELKNQLAHYIVVCDEKQAVAKPEVKSAPEKDFSRLASRVKELFNYDRFFSRETPSSGQQYIIGFAGCWIMADETHIISLAVRKTDQHRGIGESLLIATIDLAIELNTRLMTLEVRASNTAALGLYYKYGFTQVGLRRGYYIDNKEDAILMSTENIASVSFQAHFQQLKQSHSKKWGLPLYQTTP